MVELTDCLRRRAGAIALTLTIGMVLGINLALSQVPLYESRESLRIVPPKVSPELVASTVTAQLADQLPMLRDRVMAPSALEEVASAYELFLDPPTLSLAERGQRLNEAVTIANQPDGTLMVTTRLANPENARFVAQEIAHRLIHHSAAIRIAEAKATLRFLQTEEQRRVQAGEVLQTRIEAALPQTRAPELPVQVLRTELESLAFVLVRIDRDHAALDVGEGTAMRDKDRAAALDRQRTALRNRQSEIAAQLDAREAADAHLADLRAQHRDLRADLARSAALRAKAEAGYRLEMRRQSERLVVVAPAELPLRPAQDLRLAAFLGVMLVSLLAAALVVVVLEHRAPAMRTARRMRRLTGIDPIASIPTARPKPKPGPGRRAA